MPENPQTKKEANKIKGTIIVQDEKGRTLNRIISPLKVGFHLKDVLQVMLGAAILAIPVGYTEETWHL